MIEDNNIPHEVLLEISKASAICLDFLQGFLFLIQDAGRDSKFSETNILYFLSDDIFESIMSIKSLVHDGIHNPCCRELRYILEASMKLSYVQQRRFDRSVGENIEFFRASLDSASISIKKDIDLYLLPVDEHVAFLNNTGKLYSETSNFVHLTSEQLYRRIRLFEAGVVLGFERAEDVKRLNDLIFRVLACSFVYLAHAVPVWVLGDWFVEKDGSSVNWEYLKSKYIAYIDQYFDYKFERQSNLCAIKEKRWNYVSVT